MAQFLMDYTKKHFDDEEQLQKRFKYPDRVNHKRYHEEFKETVRKLSEELERDGASVSLVGKINSGVAEWLITHIKREDVRVAKHIEEQL